MNSSYSNRALSPYDPLTSVFSLLAISAAVALNPGITRPAQIPMFFAIAAMVMFVLEASSQQSRETNASFSIRAIWRYAPLRIIFSVLAVFSAIALYVGIPRLAQSPMLFAIAAMVMFAIETSLFEFGIRHIKRRASPSWATRSKRIVQLFMEWTEGNVFYRSKKIEAPLGLLTFFNALGSHVLESGFFLSIAWSTWHRYSCPYKAPIRTWIVCSQQALLPCAMVVFIGFLYHLSRRRAKVDLLIAEELFPGGHVPNRWIGSRDPLTVTISLIAFFLLYVELTWISDNVRLVSLSMLVIACIDFNSGRLINARVDTYLTDPEYAPLPEDKDYSLICERRRIIRDYLYKRPQLWKEAARIVGCAIAFGFAMSGARSVSYVFLISTLIVNEVVTWRWRADRDRAFLSLEGRP
jgi:hypothetical protein